MDLHEAMYGNLLPRKLTTYATCRACGCAITIALYERNFGMCRKCAAPKRKDAKERAVHQQEPRYHETLKETG